MAEQLQQFTDPEMEAALRQLGAEIAYPPTPDIAVAVRQRIAAQPARPHPWWLPSPTTRRRLTFALALLIALALLLGAIPPVRKGVARRLGLSNVEIVNVTAVPTPTSLPPTATPAAAATPARLVATDVPPTLPATATIPANGLILRAGLGDRTTLTEAQSRLPFVLQTPALPELGTPDEVYVRVPPPGGRVSLIYDARAGLPTIAGSDITLLVQEFRGGIDQGIFQKGVPSGSRVEPVTVNGTQGYWIEGGLRAIAYTDANGAFQFEEIRGAGNTLLWQRDDVVYRLESALPKADALRIAASV
jgi:hypothetical protein